MTLSISFNQHQPVSGEASIDLPESPEKLFSYIAEGFFKNYIKWAPEVVELEPLDGEKVFVGAKARQLRIEKGFRENSLLCVTRLDPVDTFQVEGLDAPFVQSYLIAPSPNADRKSRLTFHFELKDLELFMRPFQKLIRTAIEEGAEITVGNIAQLVADDA